MRGFFRPRLAPGLAALGLAVAGAAGLGPRLAAPGSDVVEIYDLSASCDAPQRVPDAALRFTDSDLGAALRRASPAPRVRLFTDGCDLSGQVPDLPDVPIDVVLLDRRDTLLLLDLRAPRRVATGVDFALDLVVGRTRGPGAGAAAASVELRRDGARLGAAHTMRLRRGQTRTIRVRDRLETPGLVRYTARLHDQERTVSVLVGDRPVVYSPEKTKRNGFEFTTTLDARVDAIYLEGELPPAPLQEQIAQAVKGGAGLLVAGGTRIAGGPLEAVLPLTDRPPEGRALVLLLDFSGSMEPHKERLITAVARLRTYFATSDRVACVIFRDAVARVFSWDETDWDLRSIRPQAKTNAAPALRAAAQLFAEAKAGVSRLFIVTDGAWHDFADVPAALDSLPAGLFKACLVFEGGDEDLDPRLTRFFKPHIYRSTNDLGRDLVDLEEGADDRFLPHVDATRGPAPAWLEGAVPAAGRFERVWRLYPRGLGERVPLAAGEIPVMGAWRRGGKVVMIASPFGRSIVAPNPWIGPLLHAVRRDDSGVVIDARRTPDGLVIEVVSGAAPILVDGKEVAARPSSPQRRRAVLRGTFPDAVEVRCGAALVRVPAALSREQAGLSNRPDIAAAIASRTGGRLFEGMQDTGEAGPATAVYITLLAAALLVLAGALLRRKQ